MLWKFDRNIMFVSIIVDIFLFAKDHELLMSCYFEIKVLVFFFISPLNIQHSLVQFSRWYVDIFLIFTRKQGLLFHANCLLRRHFAWNTNPVFISEKNIGLDKGGYPVNIFLISPWKHMLWVLIWSALARRFKWVPTTCFHGEIRKISILLDWKKRLN